MLVGKHLRRSLAMYTVRSSPGSRLSVVSLGIIFLRQTLIVLHVKEMCWLLVACGFTEYASTRNGPWSRHREALVGDF